MNFPSGREAGTTMTAKHVVTRLRAGQEAALRFATAWPEPEHVIVSVRGEIDAANAHTFRVGVLARALSCRRMTLDLTGVSFFSSAGYQALCVLHQRCAAADMDVTLAPSPVVRRVLQICGPPPVEPRSI